MALSEIFLWVAFWLIFVIFAGGGALFAFFSLLDGEMEAFFAGLGSVIVTLLGGALILAVMGR